jgi:hypothetical protein
VVALTLGDLGQPIEEDHGALEGLERDLASEDPPTLGELPAPIQLSEQRLRLVQG